ELVIFDSIGTLFDMHAYCHGMAVLRAEALCSCFDLPESMYNELISVMEFDIERYRHKSFAPVNICSRQETLDSVIRYLNATLNIDTACACKESFRHADDASIEYLDDLLKPLAGAELLIKSLAASETTIALAEPDSYSRAKLYLEKAELSEYFSAVAGPDSVNKTKPFAEQAALLSRQCGVVSEKTVCIGDEINDILMAENAGFKAAIGVASGSTSSRLLYEYTPFVVESLTQIGVRYALSSVR
ncbi:HAD family hydrolase, partial [bacterium]|nr:HAD family hydrolase [bacterium]